MGPAPWQRCCWLLRTGGAGPALRGGGNADNSQEHSRKGFVTAPPAASHWNHTGLNQAWKRCYMKTNWEERANPVLPLRPLEEEQQLEGNTWLSPADPTRSSQLEPAFWGRRSSGMRLGILTGAQLSIALLWDVKPLILQLPLLCHGAGLQAWLPGPSPGDETQNREMRGRER